MINCFVVIIHRQYSMNKKQFDTKCRTIFRTVGKGTLGYNVKTMKKVNVNFAWLGGTNRRIIYKTTNKKHVCKNWDSVV